MESQGSQEAINGRLPYNLWTSSRAFLVAALARSRVVPVIHISVHQHQPPRLHILVCMRRLRYIIPPPLHVCPPSVRPSIDLIMLIRHKRTRTTSIQTKLRRRLSFQLTSYKEMMGEIQQKYTAQAWQYTYLVHLLRLLLPHPHRRLHFSVISCNEYEAD